MIIVANRCSCSSRIDLDRSQGCKISIFMLHGCPQWPIWNSYLMLIMWFWYCIIFLLNLWFTIKIELLQPWDLSRSIRLEKLHRFATIIMKNYLLVSSYIFRCLLFLLNLWFNIKIELLQPWDLSRSTRLEKLHWFATIIMNNYLLGVQLWQFYWKCWKSCII